MTPITHIGLSVPDLDEAIRWYQDVFGFYILAGPFDFEEAGPEAEARTQDLQGNHVKKMRNVHLMSGDGVGLELFEFQEPRPLASPSPVPSGFFHICFVVPDLVETIERIIQNGGRQRSQIWNMTDGKPHFLVYTEDPFGNIIELMSRSTGEIYGHQ